MSNTISKNDWKKLRFGIFLDYNLFDNTNVLFDVKSIVKTVKDSNAKYLIIPCKNLDGFCLWRTHTTTYFNDQDILKDISDECNKQDIKLGLYYPLIDLTYRNTLPHKDDNSEKLNPKHFKYVKDQLRELLTKYGDITSLIFDTGTLETSQSYDLRRIVKSFQPNIMINSNIFNYQFDYISLDKTFDISKKFNSFWEYTQTLDKFKTSSSFIYSSFSKIISHGGNYLLKVKLDNENKIKEDDKNLLLQIGKDLERFTFIESKSQSFNIKKDYSVFGGTKYYNILVDKKDINISFCLPSPPCRLIDEETKEKIDYVYKDNILTFRVDKPSIISFGCKKPCNLENKLHRLKNKVHRILLDEAYYQIDNNKKLFVNEYKIQTQPIKKGYYKIEIERSHALCEDKHVFFNKKKVYFSSNSLRVTLEESILLDKPKVFTISNSIPYNRPSEITCKNLHVIFSRIEKK